jgi:hypothetical protein
MSGESRNVALDERDRAPYADSPIRLIKGAFWGRVRSFTALLTRQAHPKTRRCVKSEAFSVGWCADFKGCHTCKSAAGFTCKY